LPVSPGCNIRCRFCTRDFNAVEKRPGVARRLLRPEQAVALVGRALELCPRITVVGIAGPGDTLMTDYAIRTFELIHNAYPQLINCLSTNGLLLPEKAERVVAAGVETVTVTVNAVEPTILTQINPSILYLRRWLHGKEAAETLINNQLGGIRQVVALGAVVKVNTVLVPGINNEHIGQVARAVAKAGASLINVIPLIPQHEFSHFTAPSPFEIERARQAAAEHLMVFSHCQRCRADACGIPGISEFGDELYGVSKLDFHASTFSHG
jgi:nitrogen fixation protein NifB